MTVPRARREPADEPDWNSLIEEILGEMDEEDMHVPTGVQERYLSQHTINISFLDVFNWPEEWIKEHPYLKNWLQQMFEDWWERQGEDEGLRGWLEGAKITVHGDAYIDELNRKLVTLYRERITETYTCSICGKEASEKHPFSHPDSVSKVGHADPDVHPDGTKDVDRSDITWKYSLLCNACWREEHLPRGRRR